MKSKRSRNRERMVACVASVSLLCGCGGAKKKWKNAPGTKGSINLDAVKEAFKKRPNVAEFEKRVNEIFEGDNLIVLKSTKQGTGFRLDAKEDLDRDKEFSNGDELIFTLTVRDGKATLKGAGVNSYYAESWRYDDKMEERRYSSYHRSHYYGPYFYHWYGHRAWGGSYYTPRPNYDSMSRHRDSFRGTPAFKDQVKQNSQHETKMASKHGTKFAQATTATSQRRTNYVKKTMSSSDFNKSVGSKSSSAGWAVRSTTGTKSSFGRTSGGFGRSSSGRGGGRGSSGIGV